jgi:hypothetical protein
MAEVQEKMDAVQEKASNASGKQVLTAAAAAAATTAATYAVRKALSHDHGENGSSNGNGNGASKMKSAGTGLMASAAATSWDAASGLLLLLADDAAESAGKYVATHGPEIVRERLIPKFIEAFEHAR